MRCTVLATTALMASCVALGDDSIDLMKAPVLLRGSGFQARVERVLTVTDNAYTNICDGDEGTYWTPMETKGPHFIEILWDHPVRTREARWRGEGLGKTTLSQWRKGVWQKVATLDGDVGTAAFPETAAERMRLDFGCDGTRPKLFELSVMGPRQYVLSGRIEKGREPGSVTFALEKLPQGTSRPGDEVEISFSVKTADGTAPFGVMVELSDRAALKDHYSSGRDFCSGRWAVRPDARGRAKVRMELPPWTPHGTNDILVTAIADGSRKVIGEATLLGSFAVERPDMGKAPPPVEDVHVGRNAVGQLGFVINGRWHPAFFNRFFGNQSPERLAATAETGLEILFWQNRGEFPIEPERMEERFRWFDDRIRMALRINPRNYFILSQRAKPSPAWLKRNPGEMMMLENGKPNPERILSFGSEKYLRQSEEYAHRLVEFVSRQPYAKQVIGYHLWTCTKNDGFMGGAKPNEKAKSRAEYVLGDFHPGAVRLFRAFLRRKYAGDVAALRRAWRDDAVTFDTAKVTTAELVREDLPRSVFRDPVRSRAAIDYLEFFPTMMRTYFERTGAAFKSASGGKALVLAHYGAIKGSLCGAWGKQLQSGNNDLEGWLCSTNVDVFAQAQPYDVREAGNAVIHYQPIASYALHGRPFLFDHDHRTFCCGRMRDGRHRSQCETESVFRRDFAQQWIKDAGAWISDMSYSNWYEYQPDGLPFYTMPQVTGTICGTLAGLRALKTPRRTAAEIAVVLSLNSPRYEDICRMAPHYRGLVNRFLLREGLPYLGAPFDVYLSGDLCHPDLPEYKLYLFLNPSYFTEAERAAIDGLKRDGKTLAWFYAPGYVTDRGLSLDAMKRTCGLDIRIKEGAYEIPKMTYVEGSPLSEGLVGTSLALCNWDCLQGVSPDEISPIFHADEATTKAAGRYADGRIAYGERDFGTWRSVWCGVPNFDLQAMVRLARHAGVHLYAEAPIVLNADNRVMMVHNGYEKPRTVRIRLPRRARVGDLESGKPVADGDAFDLTLGTPETRLLKLDYSAGTPDERPGGIGPAEASECPGILFRYRTDESRYCTVAWTTNGSPKTFKKEFRTVGDGRVHTYWLDLSLGNNSGIGFWYRRDWKGTISRCDVLDCRRHRRLDVEGLRFVKDRPELPPDVVVDAVFPSEGINRVGQPAPLEFALRNLGTEPARDVRIVFDVLPDIVEKADGPQPFAYVPPSTGYDSSGGRLPNQVVGTVPLKAVKAGRGVVRGTVRAAGTEPVPFECPLEVLPSLGLPPATYVPEPHPVRGPVEVGAIAFPGWDTHRWDLLRNLTPERKPLLGWYDETSPVTMDWRIKYLAENGITFLLVDWFPRKTGADGALGFSHGHWIGAFRQARYRRFMKWAVLWENEMRGHDPAFIREAARHLIDNCFSMPEYYRIDNKPVVAVWNAENFDRDLPGFGAKGVLALVREMAAKAGYEGVHFLARRKSDFTARTAASLVAAGFDAFYAYNYKGEGSAGVSSAKDGRRPFAEVAETSFAHWRSLRELCGAPFLPCLSTGWDDRPWYGDRGLELYGRTPELFARICRDARRFAEESGVRRVLVAPLDEWGEGSYADPCRQFGFGMLEAVREAFCDRPANGWPVNVTPRDVGLSVPQALPQELVANRMTLARPRDVKVRGAVGEKADRFFRERLISSEGRARVFDEARQAYRDRNDDEDGVSGRWRGEFWGKDMLSLARVADHLDSADLRRFAQEECHRVMAYQDADGYLGSYADREFVVVTETNACWKKCGWYPCWNIWNRKYAIWGMLEASRVTGDRTILDSAVRQTDQLIGMMHRKGIRLYETGTIGMNGLPSMSLLAPLLQLYRETGKADYLAFAREMIPDWDRADGAAPNLLRNAGSEDPPYAWYPRPDRWAKSYELMSCLEGLLDYYRLTGETRVFEAVKAIRDSIAATESNALGGVGYCDKFCGAARRVNALSEVCDSVHWIRLNRELFLLTGEPRYLDAMERTFYNAFLAGILRDGTYTAFAVRAAQRHAVAHQCGYVHNHCCADNAPRTFVDMAETTVTRDVDHALYLNFYHDAEVTVDGVRFEISGDYPVGDEVTVRITTPVKRQVKFRIPGFGRKPTVWKSKSFPAGVHVEKLRFDMAPQLVERPTEPGPDVPGAPPEKFFLTRYVTKSPDLPEFADIRAGFRTVPAATVMRGPLVLAKARRVGASREEIFPAQTVNGRGYSVSATPVEATGVWGAWTVTLSKPGEKPVTVRACDFASAGDEDLPTGADAFSVWF